MTTTKKVSATSKTRFNMAHENMLWAVVMFATSPTNVLITQSVAAFNSMILSLQSNLNTVDTLRYVVDMPITGYAAQKKASKAALVTVSVQIMRATYSYAVINNNPVLAAQMDVAPSDLNQMSYLQLVQFVGGAIQIVSPLATAGTLATVNVTAAKVTAWQTLLTALQNILSNPKNAIANRVALNKNIYSLLRDCMFKLTNEGDTLIYQFQQTNLNYFNTYWSNRKLNTHHVPTQLRAHVMDDLSQPVSKATVSIQGTQVTGMTDDSGYCFLDGFGFGDFSVTVTTQAGSYVFGPFDFKKGESLTLHFTVANFVQPVNASKTGVTVGK